MLTSPGTRRRIGPGLDEGTELGLSAGRRRAACAGMPAPSYKRILCHVMNEIVHRLAAVALGVLDLFADLAQRLADPRHLDGRQVPFGMAGRRRGIEVFRPVAGRAAHADGAEAVDAAHDERQVRVAVVALRRAVARRVAVHAACAGDDLSGLAEEGERTLLLVGNGGEIADRLQARRRIGRCRRDREPDADDRHRACESYRYPAHTHSLKPWPPNARTAA